MSETMIEIAKEKDDGRFAKLGMRVYLAAWFDIDQNSPCIIEIIDYYLKHIDNISFDKYVYGLSGKGCPLIIKRKDLESDYKDLLSRSSDLEVIADLFLESYNQKLYVDKISDCLYSPNINLKQE